LQVNNPLISIVIPTYNQAHFLTCALQSVRAQTYRNWEVIIINNYSEDETIQVIEAIDDERITVINFKNHGVIGASRNEGIRQAKGEFVAFLDSDDHWYPDKLRCCLDVLKQGYDLVCHGEIWSYENGSSKKVTYGPLPQARYEQLLYQGNCVSTSATVVRKALLDKLHGFSPKACFITAEDYDLWLRIAKEGGRYYFIAQMLGEYRLHAMSASKNILRHQAAILAVIQAHHVNWRRNHIDNIKYRRRCARLMTSIAKLFIERRDFFSTRKQIAQAFQLWPIGWRNYAISLFAATIALSDRVKRAFCVL